MLLEKTKRIDRVWENICRREGEIFYTATKRVPYDYVIRGEHLYINNDPKRKISKDSFEKALLIENPTPSKLQQEGIWGPSYVYGIITDNRIV